MNFISRELDDLIGSANIPAEILESGPLSPDFFFSSSPPFSARENSLASETTSTQSQFIRPKHTGQIFLFQTKIKDV